MKKTLNLILFFFLIAGCQSEKNSVTIQWLEGPSKGVYQVGPSSSITKTFENRAVMVALASGGSRMFLELNEDWARYKARIISVDTFYRGKYTYLLEDMNGNTFETSSTNLIIQVPPDSLIYATSYIDRSLGLPCDKIPRSTRRYSMIGRTDTLR